MACDRTDLPDAAAIALDREAAIGRNLLSDRNPDELDSLSPALVSASRAQQAR